MEILTLIMSLIGSLASVPFVGKFLAIVIPAAASLILVINGLMAIWAALVMILNGLSKIPGLSKLAAVASGLSVEYNSVISFEQSTLLPILQQISAFNLPVTPASQAAALAKKA
jgi:hypothetical protein